ncbi:zf-RVT domain-containing protein, partial [Cephalotus follicularis]
RLCADKLIWSKHSTGIYTIKTGYHPTLEVVNGNREESISSNAAPTGLWKWPWGLNLPHKIKLFGWKCCRRIFPVNLTIANRVPHIETEYSICHNAEEPIMHVIFRCPWATHV